MKGIPCSSGIGLGETLVLTEQTVEIIKRSISDAQKEIERFQKAVDKARDTMQTALKSLDPQSDKDAYGVRQAHLFMLDDPDLADGTEERIRREKVNAEYALDSVISLMREELCSVDDALIRARSSDLKDIEDVLLKILTNRPENNDIVFTKDVVIVAKEISPSGFLKLLSSGKEHIRGIICESGSITSHLAILCRSNGVPAVFGVDCAVDRLREAKIIYVNGSTGDVEVSVSPKQITILKEKIARIEAVKAELSRYVNLPGQTKDGRRIEVAANIAGYEDACQAQKVGAEGVGLFRTELMYMNCTQLPSEEEQFNVYRSVLKALPGRQVTVRTLDAGGDKVISGISQDNESNPFLGVRAIRLCLANKELFLTQLRALLRAAAGYDLQIMIPMISGITELRETKIHLQLAKKQLKERGEVYEKNVRIGVMIEVPSAAICADILAEEADFFSVGTNDLTQYILAADRNNRNLANLYSEFDPAVLRMVQSTIMAAHSHGIPACICGEFAANMPAVPLLVGMGIDKLSVSPASVLKVKKLLSDITFAKAKDLARRTLQLKTANEVREYLMSAGEAMDLNTMFDL